MSQHELTKIELSDLHLINILICYLLSKMSEPVPPDDLYDIVVGSGIINYFYYNDSLSFLTQNGSIVLAETPDGTDRRYMLLPRGELCAKRLKDFVPKIFRDRLVLTAIRYTARQKYENEVKITFEEMDKGYYLHLRCLDQGDDALDLKLSVPDLQHAKLLGEQIMKNPAGFYGRIIELALSNKEPEVDLSDN